MYYVGLQNFTYWTITETNGVETYSTAYKIDGNISASATPNTVSGSLYADNVQKRTTNKMTSKSIALEVATIPIEDQARMLGHKVTNGQMIVNKDDTAPYLAIAYERTGDQGERELKVFYKGKVTEPTENATTQGENVTYQTPSLTYTAVYDNEGDLESKVDTSDTTVPADIITNWYVSPQKPTVTP